MELASALSTIQAISGCHTIQYPSGRWGFCGRVPMALAYTNADGSIVNDELAANISSHGAGLFGKSIRRVTFSTESEALAALETLTKE